MEGSYGENGYNQLKEHLMAKNNCLAVAEKIPYPTSDEEVWQKGGTKQCVFITFTLRNVFTLLNNYCKRNH